MLEIRLRIAGCFDGAGNFAFHEYDEHSAKELLKIAIDNNVIQEYKEIAVYHLVTNYRGIPDVYDKIERIIQFIDQE